MAEEVWDALLEDDQFLSKMRNILGQMGTVFIVNKFFKELF